MLNASMCKPHAVPCHYPIPSFKCKAIDKSSLHKQHDEEIERRLIWNAGNQRKYQDESFIVEQVEQVHHLSSITVEHIWQVQVLGFPVAAAAEALRLLVLAE
jgi:hypothetical protein